MSGKFCFFLDPALTRLRPRQSQIGRATRPSTVKTIRFPTLGSLTLLGCVLTLSVRADSAESGEIQALPNGLVLPAVWPPIDGDPNLRVPMQVPYLKDRPEVHPINVGRQLFVDDFLIEASDLRREFHQATKYARNPVLRPATPAELNLTHGREGDQAAVCYLGHGGVFYDPQDQLFKMWYTAGWRGGLAIATSLNAIDWSRPAVSPTGDNVVFAAPIDPVPGEAVIRTDIHAGWDNSVWLDLTAKNAGERVKLMAERRGYTHTLHVSEDGKSWGHGLSTGKAGDYSSFFFNPFRNVWVYSIKRNGPHGRTRYYAESSEFLTPEIFNRSVFWVGADALDEPDPAVGDAAQLYSLNAIAYESILLGMFYIHLGPKNSICQLGLFPKVTELKLGFSRDGFHWDRPDRRPFLAPTRRDGDWDRSYIHSTTGVCLVVGDWLYFPYTGFSGQGPDGHRGMYSGGSIGLAMLRRDGFASMNAGEDGGYLLTRPVRFDGRHLFVNTACLDGELRVEVLDHDGKIIYPFSQENCVPLTADLTKAMIRWHGVEDLSSLQHQSVRFRFLLKNGSLFSFWVSPDSSGASRGYLAAGGPGHSGVIDLPMQTAP